MKPAARPIAPAAVPAQAWSDMAALERLAGERSALSAKLRAIVGTRSDRQRGRLARLQAVTREIIERETRLARLGIDPAYYADRVSRPFSETEH